MFELLFSPFSYLKITWERGLTSKRFFDIGLPIILSLITVILLILLRLNIENGTNIFNNDITYYLSGFFQTIPGFYIAGLAAIATLNSDNMDVYMTDPCPKLNGEKVKRRLFLAQLFSYLTIGSLILFILTLIGRFAASINILQGVSVFTYYFTYAIFSLIYFYFFWQIMVLTCLGLYYLGEKIHYNDPKDMDDREIVNDE
jgi:hypothetical protein